MFLSLSYYNTPKIIRQILIIYLLSGERGHSAFSSANQSEVRVTSRHNIHAALFPALPLPLLR